jgi:hypothetical protein
MEHCSGGDVGAKLRKNKKSKEYITEDIIWKIFTQVMSALA